MNTLFTPQAGRTDGQRRLLVVCYIVFLHIAIVWLLWLAWRGGEQVSAEQAIKIAKGDALATCIEAQIAPEDCKNLKLTRIGDQYASPDGAVQRGHYFELSAGGFHANVVLDAQGELVTPTPLLVE